MFRLLRRLYQPALGSQSTRPVLAAATSSRAFHTPLCAETEEYMQDLTDPYHYTTGRWLNRDKLQRGARYVKFDFPALVFILYLDNGERVVARVPFRIAGPRRLVTNSEVATMTYARTFTKIPVPKVLDWSDDDNNSIGSEYIIMEHVPGVQLHEKWPSMNPHQHMLCVKKVAFIVTEMAKLPFPAYGSLYFANAPIDPKSKIAFAEGFCIGPHCGTQYWDCDAGEARFYEEKPPNRGPWTGLQPYCSGLIDAGFSRIPKSDSPVDALPYRGSVQEHLHPLSISEKVIDELVKAPIIHKVASPTLLHPDLHKRNIYVSVEDPSCVTAIIDWQSTSIEPTFVYANETPDLAEDPAADVPVLEKLLSSAEDNTSSEAATEEAVVGIVLRGYAPKLHDARTMDQTLLRPFRYCGASWRDSAAALRQELIELSQRWTELGLPGSCPYQPTLEELAEHAKQYEDFESAQQLKIFLKRALDADSDGWVPAGNWEAARKEHKTLFDQWIESIKESGSSEDHARKLWPFDEI
ncbi:kinase-like domain-containing protein [Rhexocercosporidium sp. MPI-PUGE-AT-0058]|nr:kinase-like domain-containing protein [Rhexocercosporidium sp. MPI-PUGE-AT-0058]